MLKRLLERWSHYRARKAWKKFTAQIRFRRSNDDDLLSDAEKQELDSLLAAAPAMLKAPVWDAESAGKQEERFARIARRLDPHPGLRETLDVLAVALMVAFGIRGLFFQPFKIPTSSMQPTLFGIHYMVKEPQGALPGFGKLGKIGNYLAFACRRAECTVPLPGGRIGDWLHPVTVLPFFTDTEFQVGDRVYRLPGEPLKVAEYAHLYPNEQCAGTIADGFLSDGDHLFVNRLSLYWDPPKRGDVIVFATDGIVGPGGDRPGLTGGYYIKRLAGVPGDTLKIKDDTLFVRSAGAAEFQPVYEIAPAFAKLYSGKGGYQGHCAKLPGVSWFLRTERETVTLGKDQYFMLGDNTRFSADSRVWGPVPRRNLIGRASCVFWPISRRWGSVDRCAPLDCPTGSPGPRTFPVMSRQ